MKVTRNPNSKIITVECMFNRDNKVITAEHIFDIEGIGPFHISADGKAWKALLEYAEYEPENLSAELYEVVRAAGSKNTLFMGKKRNLQRERARKIAPDLYYALQKWLRKKSLPVFIPESYLRHGIPQSRTEPLFATMKMLTNVYGNIGVKGPQQSRTYYVNYIYPHRKDVIKRHKKLGEKGVFTRLKRILGHHT